MRNQLTQAMTKKSGGSKEMIKFGLALGLLALGLQILQFQSSIRNLTNDWLLAAVAALFLTVGLWVGFKVFKSRQEKLTTKRKGNPKAFGLSDREMDVLVLIADGMSNKEIAEKLFVSENTVKTHLAKIFGKLHAQRRTQAVQKAREYELI